MGDVVVNPDNLMIFAKWPQAKASSEPKRKRHFPQDKTQESAAIWARHAR